MLVSAILLKNDSSNIESPTILFKSYYNHYIEYKSIDKIKNYLYVLDHIDSDYTYINNRYLIDLITKEHNDYIMKVLENLRDNTNKVFGIFDLDNITELIVTFNYDLSYEQT